MYDSILKHWGILLSLVLVAGLFAIGFIDQDVYGPEEPEKLNLGGTGYDDESGTFAIKVSSRWGPATAGENARFVVSCTLQIDKDGDIETVDPKTKPVKKLDETTDPPRNEPVPLEPVEIRWDPAGFSGTAEVTTTCEMQKNGKTVANSETSRRDFVEIEDSSPPEPPACEESCEVKVRAVFEACSAAESVLGIPLECSKIADETHVRCISSCGTGEERTCEECCLSALGEIIPLCGDVDDCRAIVADAFLTTCAGTCEELS